MKLSEWLETQTEYTHFIVHAKGPINSPEFRYSFCVHPKNFPGHIHFYANDMDPELPDKFHEELKRNSQSMNVKRMKSLGLNLPMIKGM